MKFSIFNFQFSILFSAFLLAGCVTKPWFPPDPEAGRQIARWIATPTEKDPRAGFQCWVWLPTHYASQDKNKTWPLLLFLHGSGECGDNIDKVKIHGPPRILAQPGNRADWPFITVSPQAPRMWFDTAQLLALIDVLEREYRVDPRRIYATGLSMGAYDTWALAAAAPQRFAAIAPVCGAGDPANAPLLVDTPVWAFHGDADKNVPHTGPVPIRRGPNDMGSSTLVEAIKKAGGKKAKLTLYPGVGHDAWTLTYNDPEFATWLLSNKRK